MILSFFTKKCTHDKVGFNVDCGYCPDCGEYVENHWYLVRCSCCGIKRVAITKGFEIMPASCCCPNCGEKGYYIEELKKLNFVDINYATVLKIAPHLSKSGYSQSWVEDEAKNLKLIAANM